MTKLSLEIETEIKVGFVKDKLIVTDKKSALCSLLTLLPLLVMNPKVRMSVEFVDAHLLTFISGCDGRGSEAGP